MTARMLSKPGQLHTILFWIVIAGIAFLGLDRGLWTPDEPREAEMGREMLIHPGFVPHLNGKPFFEKPPLYYWAVAGAYKVAGVSEGVARTVSSVFGLATLVLVFFWVKRDASKEAAYMAVFVLATCVQFFQSTHWVLLDPALMFFLVVAAWGAWTAMSRGPGLAALLSLYGGMCMAVWTKGLLGVALPTAGLLPFLILRRRDRPWRPLKPLLGVSLTCLFIGLCLWAFYAAEGWDALYQLVWVNHVERFIRPSTTGHAQPFYYYLQALPVAVLPWLFPFLALFRPSFWRQTGPSEKPAFRLYLACSVLGALLLLSLASTKRETYLLPLVPLLAVLMALALDDAIRLPSGTLDGPSRWLFGRLQPAFLSLWGLVVPVALIVYTKSPRPLYLVLLLAGLGFGLAGIYFALRDRFAPAWDAHRASAVLMCVAAIAVAAPVADAQKNMAPFCRWVGLAVPGRAAIPALGADETLCGIIPFTTGRTVESLSPSRWTELADTGMTPEYVLEQVGREDAGQALSPAVYEKLGERKFGPGRTLRLWHKAKQREPNQP